MLLHIPVVEIRAFLVLPQIQKGQKKAAEMEEWAGGGGCCFRGRFSTEICAAACLLPQLTLEPATGCFQSFKKPFFFQIECCFLCLIGKELVHKILTYHESSVLWFIGKSSVNPNDKLSVLWLIGKSS